MYMFIYIFIMIVNYFVMIQYYYIMYIIANEM